jgi:tetratricopeptide (TPR) repeat protein
MLQHTALAILVLLGSACSTKTVSLNDSPLWKWRRHFDAGKAAYARGDLPTAEREFNLARSIARYEKPPGLATALSLNALSTMDIDAGHAPEAQPLVDEAIRIFEERGFTDHESFAMLLTNRGSLSIDLGRPADAELEYRRALAIEGVPRSVHDRAVRGLVASLCMQGRLVDAREVGSELGIACRAEDDRDTSNS